MTLSDWNKYFEDVKTLRDKIYEGTKTTNGLTIKLEMEDCDILWQLLTDEVDKIYNTPLEFRRKWGNMSELIAIYLVGFVGGLLFGLSIEFAIWAYKHRK